MQKYPSIEMRDRCARFSLISMRTHAQTVELEPCAWISLDFSHYHMGPTKFYGFSGASSKVPLDCPRLDVFLIAHISMTSLVQRLPFSRHEPHYAVFVRSPLPWPPSTVRGEEAALAYRIGKPSLAGVSDQIFLLFSSSCTFELLAL